MSKRSVVSVLGIGSSQRLGVCIALSCTWGSACDTEPTAVAQHRQALEAPECTALGNALVDHSCGHVMFGPFQMVTADPNVDFSAAQPNINPVHTQYTVTVPESAAGVRSGTVKYRVQRTGRWIVFANPVFDVPLLNAAGAPMPSSFMEEPAGCTGLGIGRQYELTANETYRLRLDASPSAQVKIIIEKLEDFEQFYYADVDRDSFGDPEMTVTTACAAPDGYVVDNTDCDDSNAAISVSASERCDDLDNDCDGKSDEGLTNCSPDTSDADSGVAPPAQDAGGVTDAKDTGAKAGTGAVSAAGRGGNLAPLPAGSGGAGATANARAGSGGTPADPQPRDGGAAGGSSSKRTDSGAKPSELREDPSEEDDSSGCHVVAVGQPGSHALPWSIVILGLSIARGLRRRKQSQ